MSRFTAVCLLAVGLQQASASRAYVRPSQDGTWQWGDNAASVSRTGAWPSQAGAQQWGEHSQSASTTLVWTTESTTDCPESGTSSSSLPSMTSSWGQSWANASTASSSHTASSSSISLSTSTVIAASNSSSALSSTSPSTSSSSSLSSSLSSSSSSSSAIPASSSVSMDSSSPSFSSASTVAAAYAEASPSISPSIATSASNMSLSSVTAPQTSTLSLSSSSVASTSSSASSVTPAFTGSSASSYQASVTSASPNGGILSIPPSSTAPVQSLLATYSECEALLDGQLPPANSIPSNWTFSGNVRTYYVAAEEVSWNYAPSGWDNWLGVPIHNSPRANAGGYLNTSGSIGQDGGLTWQKAQYVGYTDASFTQKTEQLPGDGLNGPTLRAEVNDMIQILFVNKLDTYYASMHSMGLYYGKQYEGSLYVNTTTGESPNVQEQDAVPPGGCAVYKWIASESQAPAKGQDSRLWSYHSYVNMGVDISAGLVGPIIIYNPGQMDAVQKGNREIILNYATYYEAESFFASKNAEMAGLQDVQDISGGLVNGGYSGNESFWVPQLTNNPGVVLSEKQAPIFYTLNGYILGNGYAYEMCRNDPVIWYVMSYGNYAHTFHMHGNNFQKDGQDAWLAALNLNVGEMFTLNMDAQLPGVWQVICHVAMHLAFGMEQNYVVYETEQYGGSCPLPPLTQKLQGSP